MQWVKLFPIACNMIKKRGIVAASQQYVEKGAQASRQSGDKGLGRVRTLERSFFNDLLKKWVAIKD